MSIFLKFESASNIIGAKSTETILIPVSSVSQMRSTPDGGTLIFITGEPHPRSSNESLDDLLSNCVIDLASYAS